MMNDQVYTLDQPLILETDGSGYWSNKKVKVPVLALHLRSYSYGDKLYGELRVVYDTLVWLRNYGLIYTDRQFKKELDLLLIEMNLDPQDVSYSEQGMQGLDYVSLDAGPKFIESWDEKFENFRLTSEDLSVE